MRRPQPASNPIRCGYWQFAPPEGTECRTLSRVLSGMTNSAFPLQVPPVNKAVLHSQCIVLLTCRHQAALLSMRVLAHRVGQCWPTPAQGQCVEGVRWDLGLGPT